MNATANFLVSFRKDNQLIHEVSVHASSEETAEAIAYQRLSEIALGYYTDEQNRSSLKELYKSIDVQVELMNGDAR